VRNRNTRLALSMPHALPGIIVVLEKDLHAAFDAELQEVLAGTRAWLLTPLTYDFDSSVPQSAP
jgi:hypothetical protein